MVYQQTFTVRKFTPKDLHKVVHINRKCLPENYTPNFFLDIYKTFPDSFLVAEILDVVGYVMCRIEFGFSDFNRLKMLRKGHLVSIAVLEEFRRRRIGSSLLNQALKALKSLGAKECYLEVRENNRASIELYSKEGFKIVRRVYSYYQDGGNAVVMALRLDT